MLSWSLSIAQSSRRYGSGSFGDWRVSMAGTSIAELFWGKWPGTTITYSFISDFPSYYSNEDKALVGSAGALSSAQRQVIAGILNYVQTITGLTFAEVDPTSGAVGNITFGIGTSLPGMSAGTLAPPGQGVGGDVWFK